MWHAKIWCQLTSMGTCTERVRELLCVAALAALDMHATTFAMGIAFKQPCLLLTVLPLPPPELGARKREWPSYGIIL